MSKLSSKYPNQLALGTSQESSGVGVTDAYPLVSQSANPTVQTPAASNSASTQLVQSFAEPQTTQPACPLQLLCIFFCFASYSSMEICALPSILLVCASFADTFSFGFIQGLSSCCMASSVSMPSMMELMTITRPMPFLVDV